MALKKTEDKLDSFDPGIRRAALEAIMGKVPVRGREIPASNLHCHSFFSYNAYGYSPSRLAWIARREGWQTLGVVDFDVLDALEETVSAARALGVRAVTGLETRVFVPEYRDKVINSPGEPGIFYLVGLGFFRHPGSDTRPGIILDKMRSGSRARNEQVLALLNGYLPEIQLDYERDIVSRTPSGNATERHIIEALDQRARENFAGRDKEMARFWSGRLGLEETETHLILEGGNAWRNLLRARLIKKGGPAYAAPDSETFPLLDEVVSMIRESGAMAVGTWLDGTSQVEREPAPWLSFLAEKGIAALNIIPDRNWNIADPAEKSRKTAELAKIISLARGKGLPLAAGTEMNSPGQKIIDDFEAPELLPWREDFLAGGLVIYGQMLMQSFFGLGYNSAWAREKLGPASERNRFYRRIGSSFLPGSIPWSWEKTRHPEKCSPGDFLPAES